MANGNVSRMLEGSSDTAAATDWRIGKSRICNRNGTVISADAMLVNMIKRASTRRVIAGGMGARTSVRENIVANVITIALTPLSRIHARCAGAADVIAAVRFARATGLVVADGSGNLWVLDPASPGIDKVIPGGAKLGRIEVPAQLQRMTDLTTMMVRQSLDAFVNLDRAGTNARIAAARCQRRRLRMSSRSIARACTGSLVKVRIGRFIGPSGVSREYRFGPFMPL